MTTNTMSENFDRQMGNMLSRTFVSSNSTSDALEEDDFVSKRFAELTDAMSSVNLTPYVGTEKENAFYAMAAQLEKPTDMISSSSGESNMNLELTIRRLLNKLTHPNFEEVLQNFASLQVDDMDALTSLVVDIVISKVVSNPWRASVFARLIAKCRSANFNLRQRVLDRCLAEFQLCVENLDKIKIKESEESMYNSELDKLEAQVVKSSGGNIRLLGELYNFCVVNHKIIMQYVDVLLKRNDDLSTTVLCNLIRTIGLKLDKLVNQFKEEDKSKKRSFEKLCNRMKMIEDIENLFDDLTTRSNSGYLSLNTITALKEILQLRNNNWKMDDGLLASLRSRNWKVGNNRFQNVELTIRKMLNKLSHSNFDEVLQNFTTTHDLDGDDGLINFVADDMMKKVVRKQTSAGVFARLVSRSGRSSKLRKGILDRCQIEFQSILANVDNIQESEDNLFGNVNSDEFKSKFIRLSAGHIRLIGELYNYSMLGQNTVMRCVNDLLRRHDDLSLTILCVLIRTIGLKLDNRITQVKKADQTKVNLLDLKENVEFVDWIETLFDDLEARISSGFLSINSETLVQEVLQLRENNWEAEEVRTTPKSGDNVNWNLANGLNPRPIFRSRKIDDEVYKNLVNNKPDSSNFSKNSSRMSTSSNCTSETDFVSNPFAELTEAMSCVNLTPYLVTEKEKAFYSMKAQLEKSKDTTSSSSGKSNMIRGATFANPGTSRSLNSIENKTEIVQSSSSSTPPQLRYLSMYTNYDRMFRQMPPEVVEEINMDISMMIYQRLQQQKELESFSASQNDF